VFLLRGVWFAPPASARPHGREDGYDSSEQEGELVADRFLATIWRDVPRWLRPWLASAIFIAAVLGIVAMALGRGPVNISFGG